MGYRPRAVLFALVFVSSFSFSQEKDRAGARYNEIVSRLKAGDRKVDFKELRLAYAELPHTRDTDPAKKAMLASLNSKKYEDALKNADRVLANDYVDMDAHYAEYLAQRELHHADQSDFHKFVFQGLLDSITKSADGKSFETAFQ